MSGDQFDTGQPVPTPHVLGNITASNYVASPTFRDQTAPAVPLKRKRAPRNRRNKTAKLADPKLQAQSQDSGQAGTLIIDHPDKKRNKLGYHRTSVACSHCRRRKIRCLIPADEPSGRCSNCIRLKRECHFFPVEQSNQHGKKSQSKTEAGTGARSLLTAPTQATPSSSSIAHPTAIPADAFANFAGLMVAPSQHYAVIPPDHYTGLGIYPSSAEILETPSVLQSQVYNPSDGWETSSYRNQQINNPPVESLALQYSPISQWRSQPEYNSYRPTTSYTAPAIVQTPHSTRSHESQWGEYTPQITYTSPTNESDWSATNQRHDPNRNYITQIENSTTEEEPRRASTLPNMATPGITDEELTNTMPGSLPTALSVSAFDNSVYQSTYASVWTDLSDQRPQTQYSEPETEYEKNWF